jgi:hypothetical protein
MGIMNEATHKRLKTKNEDEDVIIFVKSIDQFISIHSFTSVFESWVLVYG